MGRKPENRTQFSARVDVQTPDKIKEMAAKLGYTYAGEGSPGAFLDAIASGDVILYKRYEVDK